MIVWKNKGKSLVTGKVVPVRKELDKYVDVAFEEYILDIFNDWERWKEYICSNQGKEFLSLNYDKLPQIIKDSIRGKARIGPLGLEYDKRYEGTHRHW